MKFFHFLILFFITLQAFGQKDGQSNPDNNIEEEKYLNFLEGIDNDSTFGYFIVYTVKDLNTGLVKEICSKGKFLVGAIRLEWLDEDRETDYDEIRRYIKNQKNRYFEFKSHEALKNISFYDYNPDYILEFEKQYDFDKLIEIQNSSDVALPIKIKGDTMKAAAHILFNRGYLTGEPDVAGGNLRFVKREFN